MLLFSNIIGCLQNKNDVNDNEETRIHNRLSVLRAERGLSRQELASAVGVNYQTIGFIERGDYNPSLNLAFALSEYFGVPIEAIFSTRPFKPLTSWPTAATG